MPVLLFLLLATVLTSQSSSAEPGDTAQTEAPETSDSLLALALSPETSNSADDTVTLPWPVSAAFLPAELSWFSGGGSDRYFSPGLGQNESFSFRYNLSQPANVTSVVVDAEGRTVRVLEQGVARSAGNGASPWVNWDGKDDQGRVVPDGVYVVRVVGEGQVGPTNEITVRAGVDTRIPGALTAPAPGDVVSGSSPVRWVFTPTEGFTLSSVT
ncbi:MAG: hypothetical protein FWD18_10715, partial [Micrococcales bacterium]|nr:hypothetical protein [Micrococcales bacterium]